MKGAVTNSANPLLKAVAEVVVPVNKVSAVFLNRILAFTDGIQATPFDQSLQTHTGTDYYSRMDENQPHAMFISNVVFEALGKYKFCKEFERIKGCGSGPKQEELERVMGNAVYTALEAEATYYESPSSKLFVDKYVELFRKCGFQRSILNYCQRPLARKRTARPSNSRAFMKSTDFEDVSVPLKIQ